MPLFDLLQLFDDRTPRDGPTQMALDQALLEEVTQPVLRSYCWSGSWASFGYSQSEEAVAKDWPGRPLVRRWTGGGVVPHGTDWTFAVIVPRAHPAARLRPALSYQQLHEAMAAALRECGIETVHAGPAPAARPNACFTNGTVCHDLTDRRGVKLCGGAQRRTTQGLLHQGSLQSVEVPRDFASLLAEKLAARIIQFVPSPPLFERTEKLSVQQYASPAWTRRLF